MYLLYPWGEAVFKINEWAYLIALRVESFGLVVVSLNINYR